MYFYVGRGEEGSEGVGTASVLVHLCDTTARGLAVPPAVDEWYVTVKRRLLSLQFAEMLSRQ